jgi:hypothetical protein
VQLDPLTSLSALTSLNVQGFTNLSMFSLTVLTQLRELWPKVAKGVTVESIRALTALRRLEYLYINRDAVDVSWGDIDTHLDSAVSFSCCHKL